MVSPMMVERRWPTCIYFATFGEEKSRETWGPGGNALLQWVQEGLRSCCARQCFAGDCARAIPEDLLHQALVPVQRGRRE